MYYYRVLLIIVRFHFGLHHATAITKWQILYTKDEVRSWKEKIKRSVIEQVTYYNKQNVSKAGFVKTLITYYNIIPDQKYRFSSLYNIIYVLVYYYDYYLLYYRVRINIIIVCNKLPLFV